MRSLALRFKIKLFLFKLQIGSLVEGNGAATAGVARLGQSGRAHLPGLKAWRPRAKASTQSSAP